MTQGPAAGGIFPILDTAVGGLARMTALIGGAVLIALVAMTCASITGRALVPFGPGPVPGDFELIEIGVGFAVFASLPWCTYMRAHARVDIAAPLLGRAGNRAVDIVSAGLMLAAAVLIAWRLWSGMLDKRAYGETTFILQLPLWTAYAACLAAALVFALTAAFCLWRSLRGDVAG